MMPSGGVDMPCVVGQHVDYNTGGKVVARRCWLLLWAAVAVATVAADSAAGMSSNGSDGLLMGPVFIYEPPHSVDFSNSSGAMVECSAHGQPQPKVQWVHSDSMVPVSNVSNLRLVLANSTLYFPPFKPDHYNSDVHLAVYHCRAFSPLGTIISRAVHVRAIVLQEYDAQVYDEYVIRGNTAVLKCHIPSFVADYVKVASWVRDSYVSIEYNSKADSKFVVLPTGELYILNVTSSDASHNYQCRMQHLLSNETKLSAVTGKLVVTDTNGSVPPRITNGKSTIHVREKESIFLSCAAQGHPPPTYSWFRKMERDSIVSVKPNSRTRLLGGLLILDQVQASDAGVYICNASNILGSERIESTLIVNVPLSVHIEPPRQVLDQGRSATFKCVVSGHPILSVSWKKDGQVLDNPQTYHRNLLSVDRVTRQHAGMYQCFVSNNEETVQSTAELRLGDSAAEVVSGFQADLLHPGTRLSLKCILTGIPLPNVTWTLDDYPVSANDRVHMGQSLDGKGNVISVVNVTRVQVEDSGMYKCIGANTAGTIVHSAKITVFGNPYIRPIPKVSPVAGEDMQINCPVSGHPIDAIFWEKNGARLPGNHRQKMFHNGTLIIKNMQRTPDAGRYTCVAKNKQGQTARRDVEVTVQIPPKIIPFSFQEDQTYEGVRASLFCSLSQGDLPINIEWFKDSMRIYSTTEISTQTIDKFASTLVIHKVTEKHSGNFTCSASNAASTVNHTTEMTVKVPPRWKVEPEDANVLLGNSFQLGCQAIGYPPPTVSWFKSTASDITSDDFVEIANTSHALILQHGVMRINSATEHDEGYYMCKASNNVGIGLSKVVFLNIQIPARMDQKMRNESAKVKDNANLTCKVIGDNPIQLTWLIGKEGRKITDNKRYSVQDFSSDSGMVSVLTIASVDRSDNIPFRCAAKNAFGQDETTIFLIVQDLPEPPQDLKVMESGSRAVQLNWRRPYDGNIPVTGYLIQYTIKDWNADASNKSVPSSRTSTLITHLLPATRYQFRIFARNDLGLSEPSGSVSTITGEEAPGGSPRDIKVEAVSSQTLRVTWKSPKAELWNGDIKGYHVRYKLYNYSEPYNYHTLVENEEQKLSINLENLRKFSKYSVLVQAYNDKGPGPNSDEIIAMTLEDVPSAAPINIKCSSISSQSLHVAWDAIPNHMLNGILQGYKVLYKPVTEWYGPYEGYDTKITTALKTMLHGLEKYTNYTIHILAFTHAGDGVKSDTINCSTQEDAPEKPSAIRVLAASLDSILVSWKEPSHSNGVITKYTVYIRSSDSEREETSKVSVPGHVLRYEAKGLGKNRRYEFWVTASTSVGEGQSTPVATERATLGPLVAARIASFSRRFLIPWKETVHLPCYYVGTPAPTIKWLFEAEPVQLSSRVSLQQEGTLTLKEVESSNNGNYTCVIQNNVSMDNITHSLVVEVPPEPPILRVLKSTKDTIRVDWSLSHSATATAMEHTNYVLSYRPEYGQWAEAMMRTDTQSHTLHGLSCGTRYQMYIIAHNRIGKGSPSETIVAKTKGEAPQTPMKEKLLSINSTFITLNLESWFDGGCPILYFVVEYKPKSSADYILVSNNVRPDKKRFVVTDLTPGESYNLRVTAHNNAGSAVAQFDFLSYTDNYSERKSTMHAADDQSFVHMDPSFIIPVIFAIALVFVVFVVACVCFIRRKTALNNSPEKINPKYHSVSPSIAETLEKKTYCTESVPTMENGNLRDSKMQDNGNGFTTFEILKYASDYPITPNVYYDKQKPPDMNYESEYPMSESMYCENVLKNIHNYPRHSIAHNDAEVPDLLEHGADSSSSDEHSPKHHQRPTRRVERYKHDPDYPYPGSMKKNSRNTTAETTFVFSRRLPEESCLYPEEMDYLKSDRKRMKPSPYNDEDRSSHPVNPVKLY